VQALTNTIGDFNIELRKVNGTFMEGFGKGVKQYVADVDSAFASGEEAARTITSSMEGSFQEFFDVTSAGFMDWKTGIVSILKTIYSKIIKIKIIEPLIGKIGNSLFPTTTGADDLNLGFDLFHTGGIVVPRFHWGGYVKRYHTGGLASDEVPAILQTEEGVVSRKGMKALESINNGGTLGTVKVQVNVENKSSTPVNAETSGTKFDGESYVVSVILKDLNNYGPIRQTLGRTS
jgi:hypothetical protein